MSDVICGMLFGYSKGKYNSSRHDKQKYINFYEVMKTELYADTFKYTSL